MKVLENKHGSTRFEVWETDRNTGAAEVLGKISILASGQRATYKGVCRVHRDCQCVINCLKEERLLEWLFVAADKTAAEHKELSRETRRSLGMRIRS